MTVGERACAESESTPAHFSTCQVYAQSAEPVFYNDQGDQAVLQPLTTRHATRAVVRPIRHGNDYIRARKNGTTRQRIPLIDRLRGFRDITHSKPTPRHDRIGAQNSATLVV